MVIRRMRPVVLLALLASAAASARWQQGSLGTSTPTDVNVMDAGLAVVASDQGLHAVYMGLNESPMRFGASIVDAGAMAGGRTGPGECVFGLRAQQAQLLGSSAACGFPDSFSALPGRRFITLNEGSAVLVQDDPSLNVAVRFHADAGYAGNWEHFTGYLAPNVDHLVAGCFAADGGWLVVSRPGFTGTRLLRPGQVAPVAIANQQGGATAVETFAHGNAPAALIAVADGGLKLQPDLTASLSVGPVSQSPVGHVGGLVVTERGGDLYARGFGFAGGDGGVLFSPVPNPNAVAQVWVQRTESGSAIPAIVTARCLNAYACVVLGAQPGVASLNWYYNVGAPVLGDGGTFRVAVDAGSVFQLTLPIADPDGDPLWITWEPDGGVLQFSGGVAGALFNEKANFSVPSNPACGTTSYPFSFRAGDGWAPNTRQFTGFVDVTHSEPPGQPTLGASSVTLWAGGPDVFVSYLPPDAGCAATSAGAIPSGTGFTVVAVDGGYRLTPNPTFCSLDGGNAGALTITSSNDAGSSVATVGVSLVPWGAPSVGAFTPGPSVQLDAGSAVDLSLGVSHLCQTSPGFPGFDVLYTHDAGSSVSVTRHPDGGLYVQSLDVCVASQFTVTAQAQVAGEDAGRVSTTSASVNVAVVPNYPPLDGGEFTATFNFDPATATAWGDLALSVACQPQRNFDAVVTLFSSAGPALDDAGVWAVPGSWDAGVVGGCNGITFTARAELRENGVLTSIRREQTFMPARVAAGIGPFARDRETVACGQPLRFSVTAQPDAGACAAQTYSWKQLAGPQVQFSSTEGQTVELTSSAPFDQLGGAVVTIEVSSDAGMGNLGPPRAHDITLVPGAFIELTHDFEPLPAREGEAVAVRATLLNTSGCDVTTLVLEEELGMLKFIDGSARLDGAAVEGHRTEKNTARIGPISVAAGQKAQVTWLARAPLRSTPRPTGAVYMGSERVSVEATPPQRCSCGAAPLLSWAALLGLLRVFRRRRS